MRILIDLAWFGFGVDLFRWDFPMCCRDYFGFHAWVGSHQVQVLIYKREDKKGNILFHIDLPLIHLNNDTTRTVKTGVHPGFVSTWSKIVPVITGKILWRTIEGRR